MNIQVLPAELTRPLDTLDAGDLAIAGGKGASLGAMLRAGLPVPTGFAVLTEAYRLFVSHNALAEHVRKLVEDTPAESTAALTRAAEALKARFLAAEIPAELYSSIADAYSQAGGGRVVVRSSATTEDQPGASFAGQHDSFLGASLHHRLGRETARP